VSTGITIASRFRERFGFGAEKGNVDRADPHVLIISGILHFIGGPPPRRGRAAAARHVVAHAHAYPWVPIRGAMMMMMMMM
jgi:hypothetical protein